jgi:hypothetical protein
MREMTKELMDDVVIRAPQVSLEDYIEPPQPLPRVIGSMADRTKIQTFIQRPSGVVVVSEKIGVMLEGPLPPSEHPARSIIRQGLLDMASELAKLGMTTHGSLGPHSIERVAEALVDAWKDPRAYTVSELYQRIDGLPE